MKSQLRFIKLQAVILLAGLHVQAATVVGDYSLNQDLINNLGSGFTASFVGGTPANPYGFAEQTNVFGETRNVLICRWRYWRESRHHGAHKSGCLHGHDGGKDL